MRVERPGEQTACTYQPVYFAFDSTEIDAAGRTTAQRNAECLRHREDRRVVLEGHCDARGTPEYNLALGERRAQAVHGYLLSLGIAAASLSILSKGEEEARGTNDAGWARDRRVEVRLP